MKTTKKKEEEEEEEQEEQEGEQGKKKKKGCKVTVRQRFIHIFPVFIESGSWILCVTSRGFPTITAMLSCLHHGQPCREKVSMQTLPVVEYLETRQPPFTSASCVGER